MLLAPTVQLSLQAQTLFLENFDTAPVTSILNNAGEGQLTTGPSPCSNATRGVAATFNSSGVDFKSSQNGSYFLGVNPKTPCGGTFTASLNTAPMNFSGNDSLRFKCRYYISNTLAWGPSALKITISDGGSASFVMESVFSTKGDWSSVDVALPSALITSSVTITINEMGGGEGVALDDIEIINIPGKTGIRNEGTAEHNNLYPNPFSSNFTVVSPGQLTIYNLAGEVVYSKQTTEQEVINAQNWSEGIYFYQVVNAQQMIASGKMIKE